MGRPSIYSDQLADDICEKLAEGKSLRDICQGDEMPHIATVSRWLANPEYAEFCEHYARARETQGDVMDGKILEVADKCTVETAAADRVKIDAYKWRASKLAPKRYGDLLKLGGDPDHPLHMTIGAALDALPND